MVYVHIMDERTKAGFHAGASKVFSRKLKLNIKTCLP